MSSSCWKEGCGQCRAGKGVPELHTSPLRARDSCCESEAGCSCGDGGGGGSQGPQRGGDSAIRTSQGDTSPWCCVGPALHIAASTPVRVLSRRLRRSAVLRTS